MKKIYYIGYYDTLREGRLLRACSLAATRKMDFVAKRLRSLGYRVEILSPAQAQDPGAPREKAKRQPLAEGVFLSLAPTRAPRGRLSRFLRSLRSKCWLFFYLLRHADRHTPVLVYHSAELAMPVLLARFFRRFRLILEIEELYSMVWQLSPYRRWKERRLLRRGKRGSLVVSELLAEHLGIEDPVVSYGSYEPYTGPIPPKGAGEDTTLVYTGRIDTVSAGAFLSVAAMPYLPSHYTLLLSGSMDPDAEADFQSAVASANLACGREAVRYLGILDDASYRDLLLRADIALNPQRAGEFGDFLFPSKILTYFAHGLPVVSTRGGSILRSRVADLITFAEDDSPAEIAAAIRRAPVRAPALYTARLAELDCRFLEELKRTLGQVEERVGEGY